MLGRNHEHEKGVSMSKTILEYLSDLPQLQTLSNEHLEALADRAVLETVSAGELFINEGDEATAVFVLIAGRDRKSVV